MAKEKDITEKQLEALNDVFADIINALIFNGRQVVKEDELEPAMPQSQFKAGGVIHEQERDVAKFWKNGCIRLALYGTENQTDVDQDMPLRVFSYDGASYKEQVLQHESAKRNRDSNIASLPTYPAITLVLHFGKKPWDGPTTLLFNLNFPQSTQTHHCCLQQGRLSGEHRSVWWFGIFGPEVKKSTRHISSYPPMAGYPCL